MSLLSSSVDLPTFAVAVAATSVAASSASASTAVILARSSFVHEDLAASEVFLVHVFDRRFRLVVFHVYEAEASPFYYSCAACAVLTERVEKFVLSNRVGEVPYEQ